MFSTNTQAFSPPKRYLSNSVINFQVVICTVVMEVQVKCVEHQTNHFALLDYYMPSTIYATWVDLWKTRAFNSSCFFCENFSTFW